MHFLSLWPPRLVSAIPELAHPRLPFLSATLLTLLVHFVLSTDYLSADRVPISQSIGLYTRGEGVHVPHPRGRGIKKRTKFAPPSPTSDEAKRKLVSSSERILPCVGDKTKAALLALQRTKAKRGNLEGGREAREKSCFIHSLHCRFLFGMANQGRETTKTTEKTLNC